jgi:hypothetical protein
MNRFRVLWLSMIAYLTLTTSHITPAEHVTHYPRNDLSVPASYVLLPVRECSMYSLDCAIYLRLCTGRLYGQHSTLLIWDCVY